MAKNRANKLKFQIGDVVIIKAFAVRNEVWDGKQTDKVTWSSREVKSGIERNIGAITGLVTKYEGKVVRNSYDGSNFHPDKAIMLWCLRRGLTNKEEYAFEKDLEAIECCPWLPYRACDTQHWDEKSRAELREWTKGRKRDSKGRWVKAEG